MTLATFSSAVLASDIGLLRVILLCYFSCDAHVRVMGQHLLFLPASLLHSSAQQFVLVSNGYVLGVFLALKHSRCQTSPVAYCHWPVKHIVACTLHAVCLTQHCSLKESARLALYGCASMAWYSAAAFSTQRLPAMLPCVASCLCCCIWHSCIH